MGWERVKPPVAVVITPLENSKHLERLRPLENGLADLVATRVLVESGATVAGGLLLDEFMARDRLPVPRGAFQVLRRKHLDQFTAELGLARASAPEQEAAPDELASPGGVYVIRGSFEEIEIDGAGQFALHLALVHVASSRVIDEFDLVSPPDELDEPLADAIDRLCKSLTKDAHLPPPVPLAEHSQAVPLRNWVMADLSRLPGGQAGPICHAETIRRPTAKGLAANGPVADHSDYLLLHFCEFRRDTPAGRQIVRRSIERLETLLKIVPDDPISVLTLGSCYGSHDPDTFQPDRADELLRRAYAIGKQGKPIVRNTWWQITPESYAQSALSALAHIGFDREKSRFIEPARSRAPERIEFALDHLVEQGQWLRVRLLAELEQVQREIGNNGWQKSFLERVDQLAIHAVEPPGADRRVLGPGAEPPRKANRRECMGMLVRMPKQSRDQPAVGDRAIEILTGWAASEDQELAELGRVGLSLADVTSSKFLESAELYKRQAAELDDSATPEQRQKRLGLLLSAARSYRRAGQGQSGLDLLISVEDELGPDVIMIRMWGFEVGECYEALGRPQEALAAYLRAVEAGRGSSFFQELADRIIALGGVPLRPDRAIDVEYFPTCPKPSTWDMPLVTDGKRLFVGSRTGPYGFDIDDHGWSVLNPEIGPVICLACQEETLWVGTDTSGLWRRDLASGIWTQAASPEALGSGHVQALAVGQGKLYVGVGTEHSGRLWEIDDQGKLRDLSGESGPKTTPSHIVVGEKSLWVRAHPNVHEWSLEQLRWQPLKLQPNGQPQWVSGIFPGSAGPWAGNFGRELFRLNATPEENALFHEAWYTSMYGKAGYYVQWVLERDGYVWFGGTPFENFVNSGLYRLNLANGQCERFGPSDGFRSAQRDRVYAGLWLGDRLWLTTTQGLCAVRERK